MRLLLSVILVIIYSNLAFANSQTITGDENIAIMGDNNKVGNTRTTRQNGIVNSKVNVSDHISFSLTQNIANSFTNYESKKAKEDLEKGTYNKVYFEDKKVDKLSDLGRKKVLLLTATNFETKIILEEAESFDLKPNKEILNDNIVYYLGKLGDIDIYQMQPSMMGMLEPGSTPLVLMSVFNNIKPDYIIATGIAFGRESKGQKLGDILVSSQIVNYETRKETNGDIYFRGDKVTSPLLGRVNSAIHSWDRVMVHTGVVLSGNVLVNSKEFLNYLAKREPEYVGGDMESYGVYAVSSMIGAKWVMIKGISDWGDGTKNDNFHKIALQNVGNFIFDLVKQGNLK